MAIFPLLSIISPHAIIPSKYSRQTVIASIFSRRLLLMFTFMVGVTTLPNSLEESPCRTAQRQCSLCWLHHNCTNENKRSCETLHKVCLDIFNTRSAVNPDSSTEDEFYLPFKSSCNGIFQWLNSTTTIFQFQYTEVGCVKFYGKGKFDLYHFIPNPKSPYGTYVSAANKFFKDIAMLESMQHISGKEAIVITSDDATLPPHVVSQLCAARIPLLAHAIRKQSRRHAILIPDWHYILSHGFEDLLKRFRRPEIHRKPRKKCVYWRGSTTGLKKCEALDRYLLLAKTITLPWVDAKFSKALQSCSGHENILKALNMLSTNTSRIGEIHDEVKWLDCRGIIDIDGNVNAWGLFWRLGSGSVVFKIESEYTNAYIENLLPHVHYIPIASNLSDVEKATKLILNHNFRDVYRKIVKEASLVVSKFNYENEVKRVATELLTSWRESGAIENLRQNNTCDPTSASYDSARLLGISSAKKNQSASLIARSKLSVVLVANRKTQQFCSLLQSAMLNDLDVHVVGWDPTNDLSTNFNVVHALSKYICDFFPNDHIILGADVSNVPLFTSGSNESYIINRFLSFDSDFVWSAKSSLPRSVKYFLGLAKNMKRKRLTSVFANKLIEFGGWIGRQRPACRILTTIGENMRSCQLCKRFRNDMDVSAEYLAHLLFVESLYPYTSNIFRNWIFSEKVPGDKQRLDYSKDFFHWGSSGCGYISKGNVTSSIERNDSNFPVMALNLNNDCIFFSSKDLKYQVSEPKLISLISKDLTHMKLPISLLCP